MVLPSAAASGRRGRRARQSAAEKINHGAFCRVENVIKNDGVVGVPAQRGVGGGRARNVPPQRTARGALLCSAASFSDDDGVGAGGGRGGGVGGASPPLVTTDPPQKPTTTATATTATTRQLENAGAGARGEGKDLDGDDDVGLGEREKSTMTTKNPASPPLVPAATAKAKTKTPSGARRHGPSRAPQNSALSALQSNVKSALGLLRSTVKVGEAARESLNNTINNTPGVAVRGLVTGVLSDIAGQSVTVESLRLYPDGVALENLAIGEQLTVEKLVVRARLQPLLAVLSSWKSTPANMTAPPILIESIRLKGIKSVETDFAGIRRAFNLYVHAPGAIIIGSLKMYDISAAIVAHGEYKGCVKPPVSKVLRLASMELANVDSRLPIAKLAGCMVAVDENDGPMRGAGGGDARETPTGNAADAAAGDWLDLEEGLRGTTEDGAALAAGMDMFTDGVVGGEARGRRGETGRVEAGAGGRRERESSPRSSSSSSSALVPVPPRPAANRDPFASIRGFVPPMLMSQVDKAVSPEVVALANTSQAVFESLAPVIAGDLGRILTVDVAEFAGGEAFLDLGIVAALMTAGLPRRFLANGGALMVKLIESGVGVTLLERAELLKVMVERRLLERMLDLDLMSPMLDRPELTKEMFRSGVVKGVMNNGVLEALLGAGKEDVVVALLRGPMLEVMMDTGLLPAMMTFEGDDEEDLSFKKPPTGSLDDDEFEIPSVARQT